MSFAFSILQALTVALGLLFVYLAAFTYETTDAVIRNRLEDLWLKLEYGPRTPSGIAERLVRAVLGLMDSIFDRVFGANQWSLRTLSVAVCYAYGAIALSWPVLSFLAFVAEVNIDPVLERTPLTPRAFVIVGLTAISVGSLPAVRSWLRWVTHFAAAVIVAGLLTALWAVMTGRALPDIDAGERLTAAGFHHRASVRRRRDSRDPVWRPDKCRADIYPTRSHRHRRSSDHRHRRVHCTTFDRRDRPQAPRAIDGVDVAPVVTTGGL